MAVAVLWSSWLALLGPQAQGQTNAAATVTEILDSNQVYIQNRVARVNHVAQQRQQVRTGSARTALRFNTGAVARLAHNSSLVIGQCAQVNRGTLLVNGTLNGCSTSTVAGVRGTLYTLTVTKAGETIIQVFEGEVVIEHNLNPEPVDLVTEVLDPLNPFFDPVVPSTDPMVPFVKPIEPSSPGLTPPEPSPSGPSSPGFDPTFDPMFEPTFEPSFGFMLSPTLPSTGPNLGGKPGALAIAGRQAIAIKQDDPQDNPTVDFLEPAPDLSPDHSAGETVDFTADAAITVAQGQQVTIDADQVAAVVRPLAAEDFIDLLEGPLLRGFAVELPGMGNLRRTFQQLFPGVPFPSFWAPPIPSPPVRFPFPF
ncbi:hypothetical protein [Nodosilinea sp. E11]|uniref:hypothetical protein n=1 Tax=Nodosilinea sp. E11 TaxID=3037479 RepID=UPI002935066D|nr:hypothetical protein [Nodosilinea sp. E11]WOD41175.1 hypothetical protein RRF56_10265 [Nodosilinea sp. E11]